MRKAHGRFPAAIAPGIAPGIGPEGGRFVRPLILVLAPDRLAPSSCYHH
jgi:hypothetical protein